MEKDEMQLKIFIWVAILMKAVSDAVIGRNVWRSIDRESASKYNTYVLMGKLSEADLSRYRNNTS